MHKNHYTGGVMEKKYLTGAGIISAIILVGMFMVIFFSGFVPFLNPVTSPALPDNEGGGAANMTKTPPQNISSGAAGGAYMDDATQVTSVGSCTNSSRFIAIDPLPDIGINQTDTITGTTSFPPGEELLVTVLPREYQITVNPRTQTMSGDVSGASGIIAVVNGPGNINSWAFELNTSWMSPDIASYLVNVSNDRFDPQTSGIIYGDTFCTREFTLKS